VPKEAHELEVRLMVIAHAEPPVDSGAYELLVVTDDYSHLVQMYPCRSVGADEALAALLHWFGTFGVPKFLVSDQGTYFKNVLLETLARRLQFQHPLATAGHPASNGTVERANRVALTAFRALLSEFRLGEKHWPQLVGLVQLSMTATPRASLGGHAPMKVFHGRDAPDPLDVIQAGPVTCERVRKPSPESVMQHVRDMAEVCDALHKEVDEVAAQSRAPKDSVGRPVDFDVGQYVLVSYARSGRRSKLKASWGGPY